MYSSTFTTVLSPYQALPETANQYAMELNTELRVDVDMIACVMISTITAAGIGSIDCIVSKKHIVPGVLWVLVGAESGSGKTPVFDRIQGTLKDLISTKICLPFDKRQRVEALHVTLTKRIKQLEAKAAKCKKEDFQRCFDEIITARKELDGIHNPVSPIIDMVTPYAFTEEMCRRGGVMASLGAEGAILPCFTSVSPDLLQPILKSWCLESISNVSKRRGEIRVDEPRLHIGAGWQPHEARRILCDERFSKMGMSGRFLYYESQSNGFQFDNGYRISRNLDSWWEDTLSRQLDYHLQAQIDGKKYFILSPDAFNYLEAFTATWRAGVGYLDEVKPFVRKIESHCVRIAIALHCLSEDIFANRTISLSTMERAGALTAFFHGELSRTVSRSKESKVRKLAIRLCLEFSKTQQGQFFPNVPLTIRDLSLRVNDTQKAISQAMFWLSARNLVCQIEIPTTNNKTTSAWQALQHFNPATIENIF